MGAITASSFRTGMLLLILSAGCDTDPIVVPAGQNQAPEVVMLADLDCVPADRDVIFDLSQTVDDRTDADDLEFRLDWESDGTFDTNWLRGLEFSHRYPVGIHDATVLVHDRDFNVATATCRVAVVQAEMPLDVGYSLATFWSFHDHANPLDDPIRLEMTIHLENPSDLWLNNITLELGVYMHYSNRLIGTIPLDLSDGGTPWDHTLPPGGSLVLSAQRANPEAFLFEPPCDKRVFIELGVSILDCWGTRTYRSPPFEFYCYDIQSPSGMPPASTGLPVRELD